MDERLKRESMKLKFDELKKIYGDNVYKDEIISTTKEMQLVRKNLTLPE